MWDVGGRHTLRPLWHHYFPNTHGIIFVVDSNDAERLSEGASSTIACAAAAPHTPARRPTPRSQGGA